LSDARIVQRGPDGFILGYSGFATNDLIDAAKRLSRAAQEVLAASPSPTADRPSSSGLTGRSRRPRQP